MEDEQTQMWNDEFERDWTSEDIYSDDRGRRWDQDEEEWEDQAH